MMKKWMQRLYAACVGALVALLMCYPQDAMRAARAACALWAGSVMPALFPYLVLSQLLAALLQSRLLIIPLSMLGGSPAGARLISLSRYPQKQAQRLAALCATASPLYIVGTLRGDYRMLLAHWIGALAPWALIRVLQGPDHNEESLLTPSTDQNKPNIPQAVADSAMAMGSVCGCMVLFSVISELALCLLPLSGAMAALLMCVLEMASGCASIVSLGMPGAQAASLLCAAVSFGGLSIFLQNAGFFKAAGIDLRVQFLAKLLHACAAYGICALLYLS